MTVNSTDEDVRLNNSFVNLARSCWGGGWCRMLNFMNIASPARCKLFQKTFERPRDREIADLIKAAKLQITEIEEGIAELEGKS